MNFEAKTLKRLIMAFPGLSHLLEEPWKPVEGLQPGLSSEQIQGLEDELGVLLPNSYREFLGITRGFSAGDGSIQFHAGHPFMHESVSGKGMMCIAEMFMLADGDQVLFDVSKGLRRGEYPVYYYAHEDDPPRLSKLADGFDEFLNGFLTYPDWS